MRLIGLLTLVSIGLGAGAGAAFADDNADEADYHFRRGAEFYSKRDFNTALGEFFTSNRLVHNHNVVFNIARTLEQLGQVNEAYRYYSSLLEEKLPDSDRHEVNESLKRLANRVALVKISTVPEGATIYINRRDLGGLGQTPRVLALEPGKAKVILDLPGYYPTEQTIDLVLGQEKQVQVPLKRILGTVRLALQPANAEARLDSASGDVVHDGDQIVPGRHSLWISAPDSVAQTLDIDVPPEGSTKLEAKLLPRPPPSGKLVVRANLDGALISVDGKEVGFTPGVVEGVVEGKHKVDISAEGREVWETYVTVTANESSFVDAKLRFAQPKVEAASKTEERASDAPASITVISREEIRAFGYQTVAEALNAVRGVYVSDDRTYVNLGFRGFSPLGDYNTRLLILVDGHTVSDPWVGQGFVGRELDVDLADVERIEVVRGAGSALYGGGAFFGVINVVHQTAPEGAHAAVEGSLGTLGSDLGRVTGSMATKDGRMSVLASAGLYDSAGVQAYISPQPINGQTVALNADAERAFHADFRAQLGDFKLLAGFNDRRKDSPIGQFGTVFGLPEIQTDRFGFGELRFDHHFEGDWDLTARAYYDASDYHGTFPYSTPTDDDPNASTPNYQTGGGNETGIELRGRLPEVFHNRLTVGTEGQYRFGIYQTSESTGTYTLNDLNRVDRIASAYLNDDIQFGKLLVVTAGVRADDHFDSFHLSVNPRLAVVAHFYEGATTKLLLGKAFRAPTIYERFYQDGITQVEAGRLNPEQIYSGELEHTHPFSDELSLTGAIFYSDISQLIDLVPINDTFSQYQNVPGHVHSFGGELEARFQPGRALLVEAAYAYQHSRTEDGAELENSPANTGVFRAMVPIVNEVLIGATELVYNSSRLAPADDNGQTYRVGEAVLWNLILSGEYSRWRLRYSAGIYNLLDQQYSQPAQGELPGVTVAQNGRTLRVQLAVAF
jgi:outer membrane receptor protein involved in Fe transport